MSQSSPSNQPQPGQAPQIVAQPRALTPQEQAAITHISTPSGGVKTLPSSSGLAAPTLIPKTQDPVAALAPPGCQTSRSVRCGASIRTATSMCI
jgi:hypothetical protein